MKVLSFSDGKVNRLNHQELEIWRSESLLRRPRGVNRQCWHEKYCVSDKNLFAFYWLLRNFWAPTLNMQPLSHCSNKRVHQLTTEPAIYSLIMKLQPRVLLLSSHELCGSLLLLIMKMDINNLLERDPGRINSSFAWIIHHIITGRNLYNGQPD